MRVQWAGLPSQLLVSLVQPVLQVMDALKAGAQLVLQGAQICHRQPKHLVRVFARCDLQSSDTWCRTQDLTSLEH